jgi:O-antigen/teichoic acid export membrane protein
VVFADLLISRIMHIGDVQRQSIISLSSTIIITVAGFLATMFFAHVVGPEILGGYFLFLAYVSIVSVIGDPGIGSAVLKRISEGVDQNEYFSAGFVMRIGICALWTTALVIARSYFVDLNAQGLFVLLLIALGISAVYGGIQTGIYGTGKVGIHQIAGVIDYITKLIVQIIAVTLGWYAGGLVGGFLAGMVAGTLFALRFLDLSIVRFQLRHLKNLFQFSFWSSLSSNFTVVLTYADTVLIGYFMSNTDVGIYRTAFQLATIGNFTTMALTAALYPRISRWSAEQDFGSVENTLMHAFTWSLILAVPACIGGVLLGDRLLYFMYGASFETGTPVLAILLVLQVLSVFAYLLSMCSGAMNKPELVCISTLVAALTAIILDSILIPRLGITGAAVALLAGMSVHALILYRGLSRSLRISLDIPAVRSICIASGLMGLLVGLLRLVIPISNVFPVILIVILGFLLYCAVLLKINRSISREIQELIRQLGAPWPSWFNRFA